jgi:RNA polymerase sigma factor (sigma-70 family)
MSVDAVLRTAAGLRLRPAVDAEAIASVYRRRHREFVRVAAAIAGSVEAGEDAVQEALTRALASRRSFRASGSLEAWLWKIVVNAARNVRRASRQPAAWPEVDPEAPAAKAGDEQVREAVASLPERQRLVLFLRYYADLDYAAIAQVVGVRRGTVSATLSQAHASLRRLLEEEAEE